MGKKCKTVEIQLIRSLMQYAQGNEKKRRNGNEEEMQRDRERQKLATYHFIATLYTKVTTISKAYQINSSDNNTTYLCLCILNINQIYTSIEHFNFIHFATIAKPRKINFRIHFIWCASKYRPFIRAHNLILDVEKSVEFFICLFFSFSEPYKDRCNYKNLSLSE